MIPVTHAARHSQPHGVLWLSNKLLREPLVGYYTDTCNTLVSIVQGVALGVLLTDNTPLLRHPSLDDWRAWLNCLTVTLVIGLVWHRYISHNQFLAWRPRFLDALLPLCFAVCQMALALTASGASAGVFSFWMLAVSVSSVAAYQNTIARIRHPEVRATLTEMVGDSVAESLIHSISTFQLQARRDLADAVVSFAWAWRMSLRFGLGVESVLVLAVVSACCLALFANDLPQHLADSLCKHSSDEAAHH